MHYGASDTLRRLCYNRGLPSEARRRALFDIVKSRIENFEARLRLCNADPAQTK